MNPVQIRPPRPRSVSPKGTPRPPYPWEQPCARETQPRAKTDLPEATRVSACDAMRPRNVLLGQPLPPRDAGAAHGPAEGQALLAPSPPISARAAPSGRKLKRAVSRGCIDEVRKLLAAGADPNSRFSYGYTVLHHLCETLDDEPMRLQAPDLVALLLEYGADPHLVQADGRTPLELAVMWQNGPAFNALLEKSPQGVEKALDALCIEALGAEVPALPAELQEFVDKFGFTADERREQFRAMLERPAAAPVDSPLARRLAPEETPGDAWESGLWQHVVDPQPGKAFRLDVDKIDSALERLDSLYRDREHSRFYIDPDRIDGHFDAISRALLMGYAATENAAYHVAAKKMINWMPITSNAQFVKTFSTFLEMALIAKDADMISRLVDKCELAMLTGDHRPEPVEILTLSELKPTPEFDRIFETASSEILKAHQRRPNMVYATAAEVLIAMMGHLSQEQLRRSLRMLVDFKDDLPNDVFSGAGEQISFHLKKSYQDNHIDTDINELLSNLRAS